MVQDIYIGWSIILSQACDGDLNQIAIRAGIVTPSMDHGCR